jgi:putative membrane protein
VTPPRRTHPITPLVTGVRAAPILIIGVFVVGNGEAVQLFGGLGTGAVVVMVLMAVGLYAYLAWTRLAFFYDDDGDLRITSGLVVRNDRRVQLSRLQSVDVTQPLLARLFGLAELRPDVAGSSAEGTTLRYLSLADAQQLRAELLARAAGLREGPDSIVETAPEQVLVQVPSPVGVAHPATDHRLLGPSHPDRCGVRGCCWRVGAGDNRSVPAVRPGHRGRRAVPEVLRIHRGAVA